MCHSRIENYTRRVRVVSSFFLLGGEGVSNISLISVEIFSLRGKCYGDGV